MKTELIKTLKVGKIVYIINSELGGTDIVKCKVIESYYGAIAPEDTTQVPYPYEDYDIQEIETGTIWDFVNRTELYTSYKSAKEDC
jgi:hypothetical protein